MVWVYWSAIHITCTRIFNIDNLAIATTLDALLGFVMMEFAQRLKLSVPEQIVVSFVRHDVIGNSGSRNSTLSQAHSAQWLVL